jgi:acyl-coenzyme A synthetase/AMP-(fatty) acid ligase
MVLCPPDVAEEHMDSVIADAEADALLGDGQDVPLAAEWLGDRPARQAPISTEWLLFTSGTSGKPKMVIHRLAGLSGAIQPRPAGSPEIRWATFYDVRRYGGLQILLRALLGGSSLVLSSAYEAPGDFLLRLGRHDATHVTGTPSHWRRALMCPELSAMSPAYVRLSGEIADQAVLDALKAAFPAAAMGHAYASTEAGVGFEVTDGLEGFPENFVRLGGEVEMRVKDGALQLRSGRCAEGYAGEDMPELRDAEGFVDTGDMLELREGRFHFVGRRGGIINVGGLKIHPEEVETVINRHPAVSMSLVKGRRNPVTGAIVVAELVLADPSQPDEARSRVKAEVLDLCRQALPPHKAPASVKIVDALAVTAGGKLERALA